MCFFKSVITRNSKVNSAVPVAVRAKLFCGKGNEWWVHGALVEIG